MRLPNVTIDLIKGKQLTCSYQPSPLIGENWIGYLFKSDGTFQIGRFKNIDHENKKCCFILEKDENTALISEGNSMYYLDAYYGDRARLVLDKSIKWSEAVFTPSDAVELRQGIIRKKVSDFDKNSKTIKNGWDHEHCEFCSSKIGNNGESNGFCTERDEWVCPGCYIKYVLSTDLSFIPEF